MQGSVSFKAAGLVACSRDPGANDTYARMVSWRFLATSRDSSRTETCQVNLYSLLYAMAKQKVPLANSGKTDVNVPKLLQSRQNIKGPRDWN